MRKCVVNFGTNAGDLPAGEELHLARRLVDVTVAAADGSVERSLFARYRAVLPMGRNVVARTQVGKFDTDSAYLDPEHALVQVRSPVRSAYCIRIAGTTVLAFTTGRPQAGRLLLGDGHP